MSVRGTVTFSGMSERQASKLLTAFKVAAELQQQHLVLQGAWRSRRFAIVGGRPSPAPIPRHPANPLQLTLALPIGIDASSFISRCRSFGATVERLWRDSARSFDHVVSYEDGQSHIVPAYHHIALCGHKPLRWLLDSEVPLAVEVGPCPKCATVSATKPVHLARWHLLTSTRD